MPYREDYSSVDLAPARRLDDGRMILDATLTRSGVFEYRNDDGSVRREYRPPDEVFKPESMATLSMVPVTDDHPPTMVNSDNVDKYGAGQVGENVRRVDNHLAAPLAINRRTLVRKMDKGKRQTSCGYDCELEMTAGVSPEGEHYDCIQREIVYNHVAIVDVGRAGSSRARVDRADAAYQVIGPTPTGEPLGGAHTVSTALCDPEGACAWVSSCDMTAADLLDKVNKALAGRDGISVVAGKRNDAADDPVVRVSRADGAVSVGTSYSISVRVCSKTLSPNQLNSLLSEALSASPDFTVRTDSKETTVTQEQLMAALAQAQKDLGLAQAEVTAQTKRADAADQKAKDVERQLVEAQAATAAERTRADEASKRADSADKARTDAADKLDARVDSRVALEAAAIGVLGRNDKGEVLGADGKTAVTLRGMKDRDVQAIVIERLDGIKVPAERSDDAVAYAFDLATARAAKAGKALGAAREVIVEGNRNDAAADQDAEAKARASMKTRSATAWKTQSKE